MKQKYLIINDKKNKQFKIQEFAELNKETMSLLCEEAYGYETIKIALSEGKEALISTLRTNNLYPPGIYAKKIAAAVDQLHESKTEESVELFFDDSNLLTKKRKSSQASGQPEDDSVDLEDDSADLEDDSADLDDMLEDDYDDDYSEKGRVKKIDTSLKIEDDD